MRFAGISRRAMIRAGLLFGLGMAASAPTAAVAQDRGFAPGARPNIVFILADDLAYADLSIYGRRDYTTPNIDALARSGVRLTQGYASSPVCSPSRAGIVTGLHPDRQSVGLPEPGGDEASFGLPADTPTLPGELRKLGYRTTLIGKWHLGAPPNFGPRKNGYDSFYGFYEGTTDYFRYKAWGGGAALVDNGEIVDSDRYLTDVLADRAATEIDGLAKAKQPFFLSLHFNAPHWPWEGPNDRKHAEELTDIYDRSGGSLTTFAEMVERLDAGVGKVLAALESNGLTDNTIVIFTSDNGAERFGDSWPFIGMKTELLEGGLRVPLILRWDGHFTPNAVNDQVVSNLDFMPTLLSAAGAPDRRIDGLKLDGKNVLRILENREKPVSRTLYWRYKARDQAAIRDGQWKYLKISGEEHLFDLDKDVRERADVKELNPQIFLKLKIKYEKWHGNMLPYPAKSYSHNIRDMMVD
ncbi:MAG: sulfatase-like hydrolase/transferase [Pontixanthobacter sp.]